MADGENKDPVEELGGDFVVLDNDGKTEDPELQKFVPIVDDGETEIDDSFDSGDEDPIPPTKEEDEDDGDGEEDGDAEADGNDGDDDEDQHDEDGDDEDQDEDDEASDDDQSEEDGDGDADDADDQSDDDDEADPKPQKKKKQSPSDRIKQAVKRQRQAERREAAKDARIAELEEAAKNKLTSDDDDDNVEPNQAEITDKDAPDPEKYTYGELDPKYIVDLAKHETKKVLAEDARKRTKVTEDATAAQAQKEWKESYDEKIGMGIDTYDDFEDVVLQGAEDLTYDLSAETAQMAIASPVGHHVIYHLASNPKLAKKLAQMPVINQAQEFGRLAARFEKTKSRKTPPNTKTKVPPPLKRRRGGRGVNQFDPETASFADFEKNANKQLYPANK